MKPDFPAYAKGPCAPDCPRRSKGDEPNCHTAERCPDWAEYEKKKAADREARRKPPADSFRRESVAKVHAIKKKEDRKKNA